MMVTQATNAVEASGGSAAVSAKVESVSLTASVRSSGHSSGHAEVDVLVQLKANLAQLEDLHARMQYLMSEIGYLTKAN
jgi:hypothetical protein